MFSSKLLLLLAFAASSIATPVPEAAAELATVEARDGVSWALTIVTTDEEVVNSHGTAADSCTTYSAGYHLSSKKVNKVIWAAGLFAGTVTLWTKADCQGSGYTYRDGSHVISAREILSYSTQ